MGTSETAINATQAVLPIKALVEAMLEAENPETVLDRLLEVREAKRYVADLSREAESIAAKMLDGIRNADIAHHRVEVRASARRTWSADSADDLRNAVGKVARFDPETGEMRSATEAVDIMRQAYRCGGAEVRITWLKDHDIDVDEYAVADWSTTVKITPIVLEGDET